MLHHPQHLVVVRAGRPRDRGVVLRELADHALLTGGDGRRIVLRHVKAIGGEGLVIRRMHPDLHDVFKSAESAVLLYAVGVHDGEADSRKVEDIVILRVCGNGFTDIRDAGRRGCATCKRRHGDDKEKRCPEQRKELFHIRFFLLQICETNSRTRSAAAALRDIWSFE